MAGRIPAHVRVHTAVPVSYAETGAQWIEGERGGAPDVVNGVPFACVLFMPAAGGAVQSEYRPRQVRSPQLLYNPTRDLARPAVGSAPALLADGTPIVLSSEDELMVTAPELAAWTGGETVRWQCDGDPQPFGPPGKVYGLLAVVRQVRD